MLLTNALGKRKISNPSYLEGKENDLNRASSTTSCASLSSKSSSFYKTISIDLDNYTELCLICDKDLSTLTEDEKEKHLDCCLDNSGVDRGSLTQPDSVDGAEERGLRNAEFFCVLCDVNLSRRKLVSRCLHLKKCAKEHKLTTKQLLQFISPLIEDFDEDDEDEEEVEEPTNLNRANTKQSGASTSEIIDLCSDSEPEKPSAPPKNALSILMSSSRQQNQMKGFLASTTSTKSSNATTTATGESTTNPSAATSSSSSSKSNAGTKSNGRWGWASKKTSTSNTTSTSAGPRVDAAKEYGTYAPAYKKIQVGGMTHPIIVDGFQYASPHLSDCYFLTHFHSDHYQGLRADFDCGKCINCSITSLDYNNMF
jgi:hypothetical protein